MLSLIFPFPFSFHLKFTISLSYTTAGSSALQASYL